MEIGFDAVEVESVLYAHSRRQSDESQDGEEEPRVPHGAEHVWRRRKKSAGGQVEELRATVWASAGCFTQRRCIKGIDVAVRGLKRQRIAASG